MLFVLIFSIIFVIGSEILIIKYLYPFENWFILASVVLAILVGLIEKIQDKCRVKRIRKYYYKRNPYHYYKVQTKRFRKIIRG